jgi:L-fucose isomerase-like protein
MTINLIIFASDLHNTLTVKKAHQSFLDELEKLFTVNYVNLSDVKSLTSDDFSVLFIATGGVERLVVQHFEALPRPIILIADGMQNSLAAALEISSWLHISGTKSEIVHGEVAAMAQRMAELYNHFQARRKLSGMRIGVIGKPSTWLVASDVDYLLAKRRWNVEYVDIPLERVYAVYDRITDDEVGEACASFAGKAKRILEGTPKELLKAMRLYRAIKSVCEEERLQAVTVSCFKQMSYTHTTGCLALSLLNDEGICAGCEGDLQSIFTMLAVRSLTGKSSFMANPSLINIRTNEIVLAHCTIGLKQTQEYIIRNHFESNSGIAIQGLLPTGEVTVVKCGGESLDEYFLSTGTLVENTNYPNMCRTQMRVRIDSSPDYFLHNPLGNHHIMVQGNYAEVLEEFFQSNACRRRV